MKAGDIAKAVGGMLKGDPELEVRRVVIDSREVQPGDLFVGIKGRHFDGNDFVKTALSGGAVGVLTTKDIDPPSGKFAVLVKDTVRSLGDLARKKRENLSSLLIGVAGSAGKTTTKEIIYHLLSKVMSAYRSRGNLNTEIGLPLALLEMPEDVEAGVFELGATKIGDVAYLRGILKPSVRVITALGEEHLEGFGTFENVVRGNGEILEDMGDKDLAVIPAEASSYYRVGGGKVITFGKGGDVFHEGVEVSWDGTRFRYGGEEFRVRVLGEGVVRSCLCAFGVLMGLGYDPMDFRDHLEDFKGVEGRMNLINFEYFYVIDDTYNANPLSVKNALKTLREIKGGGKRVAVLGDMLELGDRSRDLHREIGKITADFNIDYVLFFGKEMEEAHRERIRRGGKSFYSSKREDIAAEILKWTCDKNIILIKGSRGMQMEYFLDVIRENSGNG